MVELTLSSNQLTGTISQYIWNSNITTLDLAFNRLQGTLPSTILSETINTSNVTLYLNNNQFSGLIPVSLLHVTDVNVLEGNMFTCNVERSDLPSHDPKYHSYSCGSDTTNLSLIVFGICGIVVVIVSCYYLTASGELYNTMYWCVTICYNDRFKINAIAYCILIYSVSLSVLSVIFGVLLYGILSAYYSTYTNSYVWAVSAIYKSGWVSVVVIVIWWFLILVYAQYLQYTWPTTTIKNRISSSTSTTTNIMTKLMIVLNVVLITGVNGLYVYAVRSNFTFRQLIGCALALSAIKVAMNEVAIRLAPRIGHTILIGICLFNNLVAPFLAEMFVSSDCFLYIVSRQSVINFFFNVYSCPVINIDGATIDCTFNLAVSEGFSTTTELAISPAFNYSYQCSSSLISSYVYIFVFRYILSGILSPCLNWILRQFADISNTYRSRVERFIPILWRKWDMYLDNDDMCNTQLDLLTRYGETYLAPQFVVTIVSDLSILVCFGIIFPPLTVVILVSVWKHIMVVRWTKERLHRLKDHFSNNTSISEKINNLLSLIEEKCNAASVDIYYGVQFGMCITGVIWAFVLFDTLSSAEGLLSSIWIAVLMIITPWLLWMTASIIRNRMGSEGNVRNDTPLNSKLQVKDIKNPIIFGTDTARESTMSIRESKRDSIYAESEDSDAIF